MSKWIKEADVNGSAATAAASLWYSLLSKWSRSMSLPQRSCAIGSWVLAGSIVNHSKGGFFFTHIPQMREQILMRDLSVPITLEWTLFKLPCSNCITGLENTWCACSTIAAISKSRGQRDLIAFSGCEKEDCEIWSAAVEQRCLFCKTPKTWNMKCKSIRKHLSA